MFRLELERDGWTPQAHAALQDVLLLARAALLHGHARRLTMRAEFQATGSRAWLARGQRSVAQREASLRRLAEGSERGRDGRAGTAGAGPVAPGGRPLVLTDMEVSARQGCIPLGAKVDALVVAWPAPALASSIRPSTSLPGWPAAGRAAAAGAAGGAALPLQEP